MSERIGQIEAMVYWTSPETWLSTTSFQFILHYYKATHGHNLLHLRSPVQHLLVARGSMNSMDPVDTTESVDTMDSTGSREQTIRKQIRLWKK